MTLVKLEKYRDIPFSTETPLTDFYTYADVKHLFAKCEMLKEEIVRCRTVGILQSEHGKFYLLEVDALGIQSGLKIQLSLAYLKSPPLSTVIPYPVQVFGTLQWKNRPVIYVTILQVVSIPMAIRIRDIMSMIVNQHLARGCS